WENRGPLHITDDVYTRVLSVRPCVRIGPDGFFLHETVAEYLQLARMSPAELKRVGIRTPRKLSRASQIRIAGGGTLIFDEYGRLKYHVHNGIFDKKRQSARIAHLWENGWYRESSPKSNPAFADLHRQRILDLPQFSEERWT
ncbi:MAG: hypothetical protein KDA85_22570, partial [Planctomycetaceae bacterium]|nr:hypothetical protein [Planctomycetaceae bacterium]